jgi:hypothetical protein
MPCPEQWCSQYPTRFHPTVAEEGERGAERQDEEQEQMMQQDEQKLKLGDGLLQSLPHHHDENAVI